MRCLPILVAGCFALAGCHVDDDRAVVNHLNHPRPLASTLQEAHQRMHARFGAARRIEQAIAFSDLARAQSEARYLAALEETDLLPAWRPYVDAIRGAALELDRASDVMAAARLAALVGDRCASCHEAIAAKVAFPDEPPPVTTPTLAARMLGHQWAATRMWEGLIAPSEERWQAGARALTTVPLAMVAQAATPDSPLDIDDVARVRLYAQRALTPQPRAARAELFGTLLATCAHCHAVLRDR